MQYDAIFILHTLKPECAEPGPLTPKKQQQSHYFGAPTQKTYYTVCHERGLLNGLSSLHRSAKKLMSRAKVPWRCKLVTRGKGAWVVRLGEGEERRVPVKIENVGFRSYAILYPFCNSKCLIHWQPFAILAKLHKILPLLYWIILLFTENK